MSATLKQHLLHSPADKDLIQSASIGIKINKSSPQLNPSVLDILLFAVLVLAVSLVFALFFLLLLFWAVKIVGQLALVVPFLVVVLLVFLFPLTPHFLHAAVVQVVVVVIVLLLLLHRLLLVLLLLLLDV